MRFHPWHILFILLALVMLLPLWIQLIGSTYNPTQMQSGVIPILPPSNPTLRAYRDFFMVGGLRWLALSTLIAVLGVTGQVLVSTMAAYAFAWKEFPGRDWLFWLLVLSMTLPVQALLIPRYILVRRLGLSGLWGLMPAYWVATGSIFLLRQFCKSLSKEILEAARLDGASEWTLLFRVAIPMMVPAIVLIAISSFFGIWGDVFWPQMMMGQEMTLPVGIYWLSLTGALAAGSGNPGNKMVLSMAGGIISLIPLIVLFVAFQDKLQGGYSEEWA